ncbi:hypothetical protein Bca4012_017878 [Brassica carinata]
MVKESVMIVVTVTSTVVTMATAVTMVAVKINMVCEFEIYNKGHKLGGVVVVVVVVVITSGDYGDDTVVKADVVDVGMEEDVINRRVT